MAAGTGAAWVGVDNTCGALGCTALTCVRTGLLFRSAPTGGGGGLADGTNGVLLSVLSFQDGSSVKRFIIPVR